MRVIKKHTVIIMVAVLLICGAMPQLSWGSDIGSESDEIIMSNPEDSGSESKNTDEDNAVEIPSIVLSLTTLGTKAYEESTSGKYTVLKVNLKNGGELYNNCQKALNYAKTKATQNNPCKVVIPKGSYWLKASLSIYSNTYLYAKGAKIKMRKGGRMIRNGTQAQAAKEKWTGYSVFKNITIDGGTWNGNGTSKSVQFSNFRFARVTNLNIKNLSILNNTAAHHIEVAAVNKVNITGCTFSGYKKGSAKTGKEAIQLDIMYSDDTFVNFGKYDKKTCYNVKISNNTFKNLSRGIGAHGIVSGRYYWNVTISNNKFSNLTSYAVGGLNFRNSAVKYNKMTNVASGIAMQSINRGTKVKYSIHDNYIRTNTKFKSSAYGVKFIGVRSGSIYKNNISTGGKYGIGLTYGTNIGSLKKNRLYKGSGRAVYVAKGSKAPVKSAYSIKISGINKNSKVITGKTQAKEVIGVRIDNKKSGIAKVKKNKKFAIKSSRKPKKGSLLTLYFLDKKDNVVQVNKTIS